MRLFLHMWNRWFDFKTYGVSSIWSFPFMPWTNSSELFSKSSAIRRFIRSPCFTSTICMETAFHSDRSVSKSINSTPLFGNQSFYQPYAAFSRQSAVGSHTGFGLPVHRRFHDIMIHLYLSRNPPKNGSSDFCLDPRCSAPFLFWERWFSMKPLHLPCPAANHPLGFAVHGFTACGTEADK